MKRIAIAFSILFLCVASFAQMAPTPAQHKHLMEHRAKIVKLQNEITRLQTELSFEVSQLQLTSARIVIENRWPASTQFNGQTFGFMEPPPPPMSVAAQSAPQTQAPATPALVMKTPSSAQPENQK